MREIKNKAVQLVEKLPDDKILYIINRMQELDKLFEERHTAADKQEKMKAYEILQHILFQICFSYCDSIHLLMKEEIFCTNFVIFCKLWVLRRNIY